MSVPHLCLGHGVTVAGPLELVVAVQWGGAVFGQVAEHSQRLPHLRDRVGARQHLCHTQAGSMTVTR